MAIPGLMVVTLALSGVASAATCDRARLLNATKEFNANTLAHTTGKIPLATNAKIFENKKAIKLSESRWVGVTKILSQGV